MIDTHGLKAALFDMGGTLVQFVPAGYRWEDVEGWGVAAFYHLLQEEDCSLPPLEDFRREFLAELDDGWVEACAGRKHLFLPEILRGSAARFGCDLRGPRLGEAVRLYAGGVESQAVAMPGAIELLTMLKEKGLKVGLVSNTHWPGHFHQAFNKKVQLSPYLDHEVYSADVNLWKPMPGIFELSLKALSVAASEAIFVGDSLAFDIVGAQRLGMQTVLIKGGHLPGCEDIVPDAVIDRLGELQEMLAAGLDGSARR